MRKIFTLFVVCFFMAKGVSQTCNVTSASFNICTSCSANISAPVDGVVTLSGTFVINFSMGNADFNFPDMCGGNMIKFGTINFTVSSNNDLILPGTILIDDNTDVTLGGNGSATIIASGVTYTLNGAVGADFEALEGKFADCALDYPACTTLEQALPVELTRFEAQSKNDMIELSWTTATELNNDFFQIEHSRDGVQFAPIGKVKGVGTTTETVNYDFMHRRPDAGTNYYRLKQVDFDGAFAYSPIVAAEVNTRAGAISLFPNPTVNKVNVLMHHRPEKVTFRLSNLVGQQLDLQPAETDAGWEMDLTRLPRGVYLLRMEYDGKTVTKRLVKE